MSKAAWSAILVLACVTPAAAQEALLPTHVSDSGEITVSALLRFQAGQGTLSNPLFEVDFDDTHFFAEFRVGVGLGSRFEIEGSFPFEFTGTGEADEDNVDFEVETAGLGDLTLEGNYAIVEAGKSGPQAMAGLVVVVPVGDDDFAVPEIRFGGVQVQDGEDGGLGEGVFKVGLQFGVSSRTSGAHVYGLARMLFSMGEQDQDDLEIDHPDVFALVGGAMLPLGETSNLDLRLTFRHVGDEIAEDDAGDETTDEAHIDMNLDARFYFTIASSATLVVGGNLAWVQDHAVDEEDELDLEDVFAYGLMLGLHLNLGGDDDK
jgi:hypothetical protein